MSRFFIRHPRVAIVIAIFFVIAGGVMIFRLPIAQFPDIVPPQIQTIATYTGADALTVEQSVATPIEEQVNGAKNMIYMQSINGNDGTMTLQVSFEVGTDVDLDQVQVQNRLAQATASLPNDVNSYGLSTQQTVGIPLLVFTITSPKRTWDQTFLSNYVGDQYRGRTGAHSRHRPSEGIRRFQLCDADLGRSRHPFQASIDGRRPRECDLGAERGESCRTNWWRTRTGRSANHILRYRAGTADDRGAVRRHHSPREP